MRLRHIWYRTWAQCRRLACWMAGRHTTSGADWGYGMKGIVDLYCPNCLQIVRRVPLDDHPQNAAVFDALDLDEAV